MATYSYSAVTASGKESKGSIEADTIERATDMLKGDGLIIVSITEGNVLNKDITFTFLEKKPKPRDMAVFCRQFVSIVSAGVSVIRALAMLGEQTENKALKTAIIETKVDIEKGEALADAMKKHPKIFPNIFITMVAAGEASGSLDVSFTRMAEQYEKSAELKGLVKKASIYPIVVVVVAIAVVIALLTFVIPSFQDMFVDLGTELPGITKAVIAASKFITTRWYIIIAVVAALVFGVVTFKQTDTGIHFIGKMTRTLPIIKNLTIKSSSASMARTLATLLSSGISMLDALEITENTLKNVYFREALDAAKDDVAVGNPLSESLKRSGVFPPLVYHMLSIGEDTGDIDGMLNSLAGYYEEEVKQATQQMMAALEPLIIIVLAVVVGSIILAVIAPMATMYTALDSL